MIIWGKRPLFPIYNAMGQKKVQKTSSPRQVSKDGSNLFHTLLKYNLGSIVVLFPPNKYPSLGGNNKRNCKHFKHL